MLISYTFWNALHLWKTDVLFEPTIKVGDIITLAGFLLGGLGFIWTLKGELKMLAKTVSWQGDEIKSMKDVVATMALAHQRMDFLDKQIEDLRNGIGFKIHREFTAQGTFEPR
jgi:hypothetical protein